MKRKLQHPYLHLAIGILSFLLLYFGTFFFTESTPNYQQLNNSLNQKEVLAEQALTELLTDQTSDFSFSKQYTQLNKAYGLSFYILENNQLTYWTNRSIHFSSGLNEFKDSNGLVKLQNGWYQYLLKKRNQKKYLALILIKHDYTIKNKYLKNTFHHSFEMNSDFNITTNQHKDNIEIRSNNGNFLFGLQPFVNHDTPNSNNNNWLLLLLFFSGYLFIISFISKQTRKTTLLRKLSPVIVILFIGLSRFLLLYFHPFKSLFHQELFSPTIFAQSTLLPSLGDLIINTILFAVVIYYISRAIQKVNANNKLIVFIIATATAISPLVLANLLNGLITNSKINFDINYLLDLSTYSFIGIGAITLLFISLVLFIKISFNHFSEKAFKKNQLITIFWILSLLSIIIGHFFIGLSAILTSWILFVILIFSTKTNSKTSFYRSVFLVLVISITTSYGFIHLGKLKAEINKEFVAKKLAKEHDPVTEYLFEDIVEKIEKDTLIQNNANSFEENKEVLNQHILNRYFGGHYSKYDINVIGIFNDNDSIYIEEDIIVNAAVFFKEKIEQETEDPFRINKTLNFLYSTERGSSYFATISIQPIEENMLLYIELLPKVFSKTGGYPELLLNEKDIPSPLNTNTYSFAKYKEGKLIDNAGKFKYSIELSDQYRFNDDGFFKTTFENAYHVIYQSDKNTSIILSSPQKTIFNYITTFSYFFIITSILVLIIGLFFKISPFNWQIALTNFSTKIQLFIIASIFFSFILFSLGTSYYIKNNI
ncbi:MAG: hypothetical protein JKY30_07390 [Flavobacteriales bacterium]|nr:hypothetical protein [Flavobacteriales bacterium]